MVFAYHKSVAPMMWVMLSLMGIELIVVHTMISIWSHKVAIILSVVTFLAVAWLFVAIRSFAFLPVRIDGDALLFYAGKLKFLRIPIAMIHSEKTGWTSDDLNQKGVMNFALIAYPNVVITLKSPIATSSFGRKRNITTVTHKFDDPDAIKLWLSTLNTEKTPL